MIHDTPETIAFGAFLYKQMPDPAARGPVVCDSGTGRAGRRGTTCPLFTNSP
jgi:hypothetical protein